MGHSHPHDHDHSHDLPGELPPVLDESIPDSELPPAEVSRRGFLRGAGVLGAGAAAAGAFGGSVAEALGRQRGRGARPAAGGTRFRGRGDRDGFVWLAGDHHIHTQYSDDAHDH